MLLKKNGHFSKSPLTIVTGAAGFVGSHLCDALLSQDKRVLGVDNLVRGTKANLAHASRHPNFLFRQVDVNDEGSFAKAVEEADAAPEMIWHMAANSDIAAGVADPDIDFRDTFLTTYITSKICRRFGISKIAIASTSAVYGDHGETPLREDLGPLFPISNYGAMKLASEAILTALSESHLEHLWIFRFPNVIGSRATHGVIYDFLERLRTEPGQLTVLGNGTQCKPYLYVSDLIDAMSFIVRNSKDRINCFNIGPLDIGVTVREIAEQVVRQASPGAEIIYGHEGRGWVGDVPRFRYSVEKLSDLGWRPSLCSADAVRRAVEVQVAEQVRSSLT